MSDILDTIIQWLTEHEDPITAVAHIGSIVSTALRIKQLRRKNDDKSNKKDKSDEK